MKCKKSFCVKCAELTSFSGLCLICERDKQLRILDYTTQKRVRYLSDAIACFVGAVMFLIAALVFFDFKVVGFIGLCVMTAATVLFACLTVDKTIKIKAAERLIKRLTLELGGTEKRSETQQKKDGF